MSKIRNKAEFDPSTSLNNSNLFINGDMSVWQRGTTFTGLTGSVYTADRWLLTSSGDTASVAKGDPFAIAPVESSYMLINPSVHNGNLGIEQRLEDWWNFNEEVVTLSILVHTDAASASFDIYHGMSGNFEWLGADQTVTSGQGWKRLEWTFTTKNVTSSPDFYSFSIRRTDTGIEPYRFTEVKLEYGTFATPFVAEDPATNLEKCHRYYRNVKTGGNTMYAAVYSDSDITTANKTLSIPYFGMREPVTVKNLAWHVGNSPNSNNASGGVWRFFWTDSGNSARGIVTLTFDSEFNP
ncbi:tail fiber protein [Vibrio phage D400]